MHDDQLLSARQYLSAYRRSVKNIRRVRVPYWVTRRLSGLIEHYHLKSRGQIPAVLTPYRTASAWKPQRFDNSKLKQLGWRQLVPTEEALRRTFEYLAGNVNRVAEI